MLGALGRRAVAAVAGGLQQQLVASQQQQQQVLVVCRAISSSRPASDLRDFLDSVDPTNATNGRSWFAHELRNKSWDDLHKLWYVCLKERNMLLTQMGWEQARARRTKVNSNMANDYVLRYIKVKKTMNRIKQVLSERAHNEADAVKSVNMKRIIHYM